MTTAMAELVVFVTGASRGIGYECAKGFLNEGARVAVLSRSSPAPDLSPDDADRYLCEIGDVAVAEDVRRAVASATEKFGRIDVLVNNAAVQCLGMFLEVPFERWSQAISVNLTGLAHITHLVLPGMLQRRFGRIINVVSRAPETPHPRVSAYAASKAGVVALTRALATEITREEYPDVQINGLIPGPTRTAMFKENGWDTAGIPGPETIYPHIRHLVTRSTDGPRGKIFWESKEYVMYRDFERPRVIGGIADVTRSNDAQS